MAKVCMPRNIVIFALLATQDVKGRVHSTQAEMYLDRKMPPTALCVPPIQSHRQLHRQLLRCVKSDVCPLEISFSQNCVMRIADSE